MGSQQTVQHIFPSTPISIDDPSRSGEIHHPDKPNELDCVSSYNNSHVTIDLLPDDVVLIIFHFVRVICTDPMRLPAYNVEWSWWYPLIHVCRKWRSVVFGSPNFLDLKLVCVPSTRVGLIDIWPPIPIIIRNMYTHSVPIYYDFDAAIVHRDRVCEIDLRLTSLQMERWPLAMQEQFPALTHLSLKGPLTLTLPDGFLGGSAPNLQSLHFCFIPFPALPKLLLSATNLVHLSIRDIPHSGYFSPEVFTTALALLVNLKSLSIGFESLKSRPGQDSWRSPPPSRAVLPALTSFSFRGVSEYVEDLVARVDAPLLYSISMTFLFQPIFDTPQLAQFITRATGLEAPNKARVDFRLMDLWTDFSSWTGTISREKVSFTIQSCGDLELQLSSLAQLFTPTFPSIYTVEHLYIYCDSSFEPELQDDIGNLQWLEAFQSFTSVKNLYVSVSDRLVQGIAHGLEELVEERLMDIFPSLERVFLAGFQSSGPVQEAIGQFVAARQLLGHPVAVSDWKPPDGF